MRISRVKAASSWRMHRSGMAGRHSSSSHKLPGPITSNGINRTRAGAGTPSSSPCIIVLPIPQTYAQIFKNERICMPEAVVLYGYSVCQGRLTCAMLAQLHKVLHARLAEIPKLATLETLQVCRASSQISRSWFAACFHITLAVAFFMLCSLVGCSHKPKLTLILV
jgi:hypothetical protein